MDLGPVTEMPGTCRYPNSTIALLTMADREVAELVRTLIALTPQRHKWVRIRPFDAKTSMAGEILELVQCARKAERKGLGLRRFVTTGRCI